MGRRRIIRSPLEVRLSSEQHVGYQWEARSIILVEAATLLIDIWFVRHHSSAYSAALFRFVPMFLIVLLTGYRFNEMREEMGKKEGTLPRETI
jgi:hypothetical protein